MDIRQFAAPAAVAGACIAWASTAAAETIFGTLTGPDGPGGKLEITCGNATSASHADRSGSYRLTVNGRGRCRLRINDMPNPELVVVYEQPTRYDYVVTGVGAQTRIEGR